MAAVDFGSRVAILRRLLEQGRQKLGAGQKIGIKAIARDPRIAVEHRTDFIIHFDPRFANSIRPRFAEVRDHWPLDSGSLHLVCHLGATASRQTLER